MDDDVRLTFVGSRGLGRPGDAGRHGGGCRARRPRRDLGPQLLGVGRRRARACTARAGCSSRSTHASRAAKPATSSSVRGPSLLFTVSGFLDDRLREAAARRVRRRPGQPDRDAPRRRTGAHADLERVPSRRRRGLARDDAAARRGDRRPTTSATSCSRRGRPDEPKGVMTTHGQTLRTFEVWSRLVGLRRRRSVPDRESVLPHVRVQGRFPRRA